MTEALGDYFEALERLKAGKPLRVALDAKITNDAVAIEAGRKKGSIKKSRAIFLPLISAIKKAEEESRNSIINPNVGLQIAKESNRELRSKLDESLAREASLLYEIFHLKKRLRDTDGSSVIPLRPSKKT